MPVWGPVGEESVGGVCVCGGVEEDEGLNSDKPKHAAINRTNPELVGTNRKKMVPLSSGVSVCTCVCVVCLGGGELWGRGGEKGRAAGGGESDKDVGFQKRFSM